MDPRIRIRTKISWSATLVITRANTSKTKTKIVNVRKFKNLCHHYFPSRLKMTRLTSLEVNGELVPEVGGDQVNIQVTLILPPGRALKKKQQQQVTLYERRLNAYQCWGIRHDIFRIRIGSFVLFCVLIRHRLRSRYPAPKLGWGIKGLKSDSEKSFRYRLQFRI